MDFFTLYKLDNYIFQSQSTFRSKQALINSYIYFTTSSNKQNTELDASRIHSKLATK